MLVALQGLELLDAEFESLDFFLEGTALLLDLVGVAHGLVHKHQSRERALLRFLYHCNIFSERLIGLFDFPFESLDIRFSLHFLVGLSEAELSPEESHLLVGFVLDGVYLLLLSLPPYAIKVLEELVHERLGDIGSALVPEVMCYFEGLVWDPVLALLLILVSMFKDIFLLGVVASAFIGGRGLVRVQVPDAYPTVSHGVLCQFAKVLILLSACQHLHQSLVIRFVMLDLKESSAFGLAIHDNLVQPHASLLQFPLEIIDKLVLPGGVSFLSLVPISQVLLSHCCLSKRDIFMCKVLINPAYLLFPPLYFPLKHVQPGFSLVRHALLHAHRVFSLAPSRLQLPLGVPQLPIALLDLLLDLGDMDVLLYHVLFKGFLFLLGAR